MPPRSPSGSQSTIADTPDNAGNPQAPSSPPSSGVPVCNHWYFFVRIEINLLFTAQGCGRTHGWNSSSQVTVSQAREENPCIGGPRRLDDRWQQYTGIGQLFDGHRFAGFTFRHQPTARRKPRHPRHECQCGQDQHGRHGTRWSLSKY